MSFSVGSLEIKLFADIARLQSDMNKANQTVDGAMRNIDKSVSFAAKAFGGLTSAFGIAQVTKVIDEYKKFDAQLKLATKSATDYGIAYGNVVKIARESQSDIGSIGVLYARLSNNLREFGTSQKDIGKITESIALSLRVSNATVQETNSVMLQLSQSFGSGKLNGQEFLAVAEGAPILLRALANSIGVPYGALKDLSAQGKLTAEQLQKAWTNPEFLASLKDQVKQVGTFSSAITVLKNNFTQYIGELDKSQGFMASFSSGVILVADNLKTVFAIAIGLAVNSLTKYVQGQLASIAATKAETVAMQQKLDMQVVIARSNVAVTEAAIAHTLALTRNTLALSENAAMTTFTAKANADLILAKQRLIIVEAEAALAARGLGAAIFSVGGIIGIAIGAIILFGDKIVEWIDKTRGMTPALREINDQLERQNKLKAQGIAIDDKQADPKIKLNEQVKAVALLQEQLSRTPKNESLGKGGIKDNTLEIAELNAKIAIGRQNILEFSNAIAQGEADAKPRIAGISAEYEKLAGKLKTKQELAIQYAKDMTTLMVDGKKNGDSDAQIIERLKLLKEEYDKSTGAVKALKGAEKERAIALKAIQDQVTFDENEAMAKRKSDYAEEKKLIKEHNKAMTDAAVESTDAVIKANLELQRQVDVIKLGEVAVRSMEVARLDEAIASGEQGLAYARLNGLSEENIKFIEEQISALKNLSAERKKGILIEQDLVNAKAYKDAAEERVKAEKKANDEILSDQKKLAEQMNKLLTDSIMSGFEKGKSFAQNFKDTVTNMFKTMILRPLVSMVVNPISGAISGVLGQAGIANASSSLGSASSSGSMSGVKGIFDLVTNTNASIISGIESVGAKIANGMGGIRDSIGGFIGENAGAIADGFAYAGALLALAQGKYATAIGTGIGTFFGGPIGGAIGGIIGGFVDSLIGGGKKSYNNINEQATYADGKFTQGALGTNSRGDLAVGALPALNGLGQAFGDSVGALLKAFGESDKLNISFALKFGKQLEAGMGVGLANGKGSWVGKWGTNYGDTSDAAMKAFIEDVLSKGIVGAIKVSNLSSSIKELFDKATTSTEVNSLLNATINLKNAQVKLASSFGLTVDQAAQVASSTGLVGEALSKLIGDIVKASGGSTNSEILIAARSTLLTVLGSSLPETLVGFDAIIKAIDKSNAAGITKTAGLLSVRAGFEQYAGAIDGLKSGVKGSTFGLRTPQSQQAMMQKDLKAMFGALNLAVPTSIENLLKLGDSIDYTTVAGLDLAQAFPSLVTAFQATQTQVDSLTASLTMSSDSFATLTDYNRYQGVAKNYGAQFAGDYTYNLGNGAITQNKDGVATVVGSDGTTNVVDEIIAMRSDLNNALVAIAVSTANTNNVLKRWEGAGMPETRVLV